MFIVPTLIVLVVFIIGRPFDLSEDLRDLPLLNLFCGLAIAGYAVDLRLRLSEFRAAPQLSWVIAFMLWALLTVLIREPGEFSGALKQLAIVMIVYLLVGHGVRTFKALELLMLVVLLCGTWIALVTTHLGFQDTQCVAMTAGGDDLGRPLGVPCNMAFECYDGNEPETVACEKAGWFGVTSIARRVRYVGILKDPNEVAMLSAILLPIALAFFQRKRTVKRLLLLAVPVVLFLLTIHFSKSRGGLLVLLTVLGLYAVQRFGVKRTALMLLPALPLLLLLSGGEERADAEGSTYKRLGCMLAGVQMLLEWPVFGVGFGEFTSHHTQTAHNSFLLAAGELGVFGLMVWTTINYLSVKVLLAASRRFTGPESEVATIWGRALGSSLAGLAIGSFFLSFTYHLVTWTFIGLSSAFFAAVKTHDRGFRVSMGWRDGVLVLLANALIVFGTLIYATAVR